MSGQTVLTLILFGSVAIIVVAAVLLNFTYSYDAEAKLVVVIVLASIAALVSLGITIGVNAGVRHDETVCTRFGEQTEREVRFARYSYWEWECLVKTGDGWVTRDNIVKFEEAQS